MAKEHSQIFGRSLSLLVVFFLGVAVGNLTSKSKKDINSRSVEQDPSPEVSFAPKVQNTSRSELFRHRSPYTEAQAPDTEASSLTGFGTSAEDLAEFLKDTRIRLSELRQLETSNIIDRLSVDLNLTPIQITRLRVRASELSQDTDNKGEPEALLTSYANIASTDSDSQLARRTQENIEAKLLEVLGENQTPAALQYESQRLSRLQDAWALRSLSELQLTLDLSNQQREDTYEKLCRFAKETWTAIATPNQEHVNELNVYEGVLEALKPTLSPSQIELLNRRWTINGALPARP
jgi:hypothetical protein